MFARTARLTLRPGWPEDAPALSAAIGHAAVVRNLAHVPWPYREEDAAAWLAIPRGPAELAFVILEHGSRRPALVGGVGVHPDEDGEPEIGYWITPGGWGRGYASEAGEQVVIIARESLRLPRLRGRHFLDNPASGRVLARPGFRPAGRTRLMHSVARGGSAPAAAYLLDLNPPRGSPD